MEELLDQEGVTVGAYNGLSIVSLKRLLVKLMYSKCHRYQTRLFSMRNELQNYLTALTNFIKVINAYKSQGESATRKLISEDLKQSNFSSFCLNHQSKMEQDKSLREAKSLRPKRSRSHSRKKMVALKEEVRSSCVQEMKLCSMSTTAFQQNTSLNLRSRVSRQLSPIRQAAQ